MYSAFIILLYDSLETVSISFRPNPDYKYMYDDCVYQMKEQNKSFYQFIGKKVNTTNTVKLGQYRKTRPIRIVLAEFFCIGRVFPYWQSL